MKRLLAFGLLLLGGCSDVGFGLKNHPGDCSRGKPWADCLPGTLGYEVLMGRAVTPPQPIYVPPPPVLYAPYDGPTFADQMRQRTPTHTTCQQVGTFTYCDAY